MAAMDVVYFQRILVDLKCNVLIPLIYVDNQSALNMCESYENSRRTRHIDIKYHYIKDLIHKKLIELEYIKTQDNVADIFTKSLNNIKFAKFFEKLNIKQFSDTKYFQFCIYFFYLSIFINCTHTKTVPNVN